MMQRHRLDPISLAFGVAFVAAGTTFLFVDVDFTHIDGDTVWPILSVFCGLLVLLIALSRTRTRDDLSILPEPDQQAASDAREDDETDEDTWPEVRRERGGWEDPGG